MFVLKVAVIVLLLFHTALADDDADYYWEYYNPSTQSIPADAFVATQVARDDTRNVYIGHAEVVGLNGIYSFAIIPGEEVVFISGQKVDPTTIQILCSKNTTKFKWILGFRGKVVKDRHDKGSGGFGLFAGGRNEKGDYSYIGKTIHEYTDPRSEIKYYSNVTGSVTSLDNPRNMHMYNQIYELHYHFAKSSKPLMANHYNVLLYKYL